MLPRRVLVIGAGGLGCPVIRILSDAGADVHVVDDDRVDASNLHRQTLFTEGDIGRLKCEVVAERTRARVTIGRFVPERAASFAADADIVVDGSDNLPTKFLACDVAHSLGLYVVHAGAVRWNGWALASTPAGAAGHPPCLRCVFEDIPPGGVPSCADVGVVGPVVGVLGAWQAALTLRLLAGEDPSGELTTFDGQRGRLRTVKVAPRPDCPHFDAAPRGTMLNAMDSFPRARYTSTTTDESP